MSYEPPRVSYGHEAEMFIRFVAPSCSQRVEQGLSFS
jgi:hypothetical protein